MASNNAAGIVIAGSLSSGNLVAGNLVGTTSDGTAAMGNATDGIAIVDAPANIIGGTTAGAANVIAGNGNGVHLSGAGAIGNLIEGDFIGTNASGAGSSATRSTASPSTAAARTTPSAARRPGRQRHHRNGGAGVYVLSGVGNTILSNSMSSNVATGIVLVGSANDGQAAPTITSATPLTTATLVSGTLSSSASTTFLIQIFSSTTADAAGSYEGQTLVGSTTITTDAAGQAGFGLALSANIPFGAAITATATSLTTGDTSEFSADALNAPLIAFAATQYYVSTPATSAVITITRNTGVGSSTVVYTAVAGHGDRGRRLHADHRRPDVRAGPDERDVQRADHRHPGPARELHGQPVPEPSHGRRAGVAGRRHPDDHVRAGGAAVQHRGVLVPESAGGVTITVVRVAGASGTVSVNYATAAVNAIPGEDYVAVTGTLTFPPGVTQESFTLPILGNSPNPNDATIAISLSGAMEGAALGSPTTEAVTIDKPLIITGERLTTAGRRITSVVFSFNKPLDPTQAVNLANFGYFVYWAKADGRFAGGGTTTSLSAATYDPASQSVTLARHRRCR